MSVRLLAAGSLLVLVACDDVTVESLPATADTLCFNDYKACVDPVFHAVINGERGATTCSASGCHDVNAGSGGGFKVFPDPTNNVEFISNINAAQAFANLASPSDSKLLLEPLNGISAISGTHTGGNIFPDTGDACYEAIINWIANQVDDTMQGCGVCTEPNITQCGF